MSLVQNVLSSASLMEYIFHYLYSGQLQTCFRCGLPGHLAAACLAGAADQVNIFRESDFPLLEAPEVPTRVKGCDAVATGARCPGVAGTGTEVVRLEAAGVASLSESLVEDVPDEMCAWQIVPVEVHPILIDE